MRLHETIARTGRIPGGRGASMPRPAVHAPTARVPSRLTRARLAAQLREQAGGSRAD